MNDVRPVAGACVLLVDDVPDQVEMYTFALEHSGFVVMTALTGESAIAKARAAQPAVIVLDVRLPDMSGWDVCAVLRSDPDTRRIPVVVLTAAAAPSLPQQAADAGCALFLLKPCYPDDLTKALRTILAAA